MLRSRGTTYAFTIIEMLMVGVIIGLLLLIAIPNWIRSREASNARICVSNLARIDAAKRQWALDNKKSDSDTVSLSTDLVGSGKFLTEMPACPSQGTYQTTTVGSSPTCSLGTQNTSQTYDDHVLP